MMRMFATRLGSDAGGGGRRQTDLDHGALALLPGDGDGAVVSGDDLLGERQAQTGARLLGGGEEREERLQPLARDSPTRVLHPEACPGAAVGPGVQRGGDADRAARG